MSKKIVFLSIVYLYLCTSLTGASNIEYVPGELLVRFAPKLDATQLNIEEKSQILSCLTGVTIKHSFKIVPGLVLIKVPQHCKVEDAMKTLNRTNGIVHAHPNYKVRVASIFPDDSNFNQQWALHNTGQTHPVDCGGTTSGTPDADIDAPQAWDIHTGSGDIIVAVLDSGVNYNHPDLAANMWINPGEDHPPLGIVGPEDFDGVNDDGNTDGDGNPLIDDIYGYDFCNNDGDPNDDCWHGTHCAGIIGAIGNNNTGVTGVCWNVKIMALKFLNQTGLGDSAGAIDCIEYAVEMGAKVLSNSYGGMPYDPDLEAAIENAGAAGVLFVASAGNSGSNNDSTPFYPASYSCNNIIAVMATDHNDEASVYSKRPYPWNWATNYGANFVDLAAPSPDILSTLPTYQTPSMTSYGLSTYYGASSGTSAATPHVAGACALIWSVNPTLTHLQVKQIILDTVDRLEGLDGLCVTGGRLNLYNAILEATKRPEVLNKVDNIDGSILPGDFITYTITYSNPDPNDPNYLGEITGVTITDYLPQEVEPNDAFDPNYNSSEHTYTWQIGTLSPGESNSITLTVVVNDLAEPLGTIRNVCILRANEINPVSSVEITDVNSWNPGIIYVNKKAPGNNTGMSWDNAYRSIQSTLQRARQNCGSEIWVAAGTYRPSKRTDPNSYSATFLLVDGVGIYGGFAGNETSREQRNYITNQTILNGDLNNDGDNDGTSDARHVVTASNVGYTTIIDGFIVTKGDWSGIYCCNGGSPTIAHNTIKENNYDGVYCNGASPNIMHNTIQQSGWYGIGCENSSSPDIKACSIQDNLDGIGYTNSVVLTVTDCIIAGNDNHGIYGDIYGGVNSQLTVSNSIIRFNGYNWDIPC